MTTVPKRIPRPATTCAALSAAAAQAGVPQAGPDEPAARAARRRSDYRALVCVFLNGGTDGNNMVIPTDAAHYASTAARPADSRDLRIDAGGPAADQHAAGLRRHRPDLRLPPEPAGAARPLQREQARRRLATSGPLVEPMTQAQYIGDRSQAAYCPLLPLRPDPGLADRARRQQDRDGLGRPHRGRRSRCNGGGTGFPTVTSIAGAADVLRRPRSSPLAIGTGALDQVLVLNGFYGTPEAVARKNSMDFAAHDRPHGHA